MAKSFGRSNRREGSRAEMKQADSCRKINFPWDHLVRPYRGKKSKEEGRMIKKGN